MERDGYRCSDPWKDRDAFVVFLHIIQSHLAIPDGHFSWISFGTTGYLEQRGVMYNSKRFGEYYSKKKARSFILVLLRRFISIKFICGIDSSALYFCLLALL